MADPAIDSARLMVARLSNAISRRLSDANTDAITGLNDLELIMQQTVSDVTPGILNYEDGLIRWFIKGRQTAYYGITG